MTDAPRKWILVTGAAYDLTPTEGEAATAVGAMLGSRGYGLIVGIWPGVDEIVTRAFCEAVSKAHRAGRIRQIDNHDRRRAGIAWIGERLPNDGDDDFYSQSAIELADAGIVISGRSGSRPAMDALLRLGKPVLPVAFLGRDSFELFRDVLERWDERPVPGLSMRQFLQLARPWRYAATPVARLLRAALVAQKEIFVSYRRVDSAAVAGRLYEELAFQYGERATFVDYDGLAPGSRLAQLLDLVRSARVVIAMIGPNWNAEGRLSRPDDWVRRELEVAAESGSLVIPVLVGATTMPTVAELPESLQFLRGTNFLRVTFEAWGDGVEQLTRVIDGSLGLR